MQKQAAQLHQASISFAADGPIGVVPVRPVPTTPAYNTKKPLVRPPIIARYWRHRCTEWNYDLSSSFLYLFVFSRIFRTERNRAKLRLLISSPTPCQLLADAPLPFFQQMVRLKLALIRALGDGLWRNRLVLFGSEVSIFLHRTTYVRTDGNDCSWYMSLISAFSLFYQNHLVNHLSLKAGALLRNVFILQINIA